MRRRAILLMATMVVTLLAGSGVALAEFVTCDSTPPCYGTPEGDTITGTASGETIYALGGNDDVKAGGGNDTVYGSTGNDRDLQGEGGSDTVYGGKGSDIIEADIGDGGGSTDHSYGGDGNDQIFAFDLQRDIIDCGKGNNDFVQYDDGIDTVKGCETKQAI